MTLLPTNWMDQWLGKCGFGFELILVTHLNSSPENLEGTDPPGYLRRIEQFGHFDYSACVGSSVWARSAGRSCRGGWAGRSGHRLRCYWHSVKQWHDIMYIIYIYRIWNGLSLDLKSLELQMRWFSTRGNRATTNLHQCCTLFKLDVSRHVADTWVLCTWLWSLWSWKLMDT